MGEKHNVIEINGRRYDAATGNPVSAEANQSVKRVDSINKPRRLSSKHNSSSSTVHEALKKSTTLNRKAAAKPKKPKVVSEISSAAKTKEPSIRAKSDLVKRVSKSRQERAKAQAKSSLIGKYKAPDKASEPNDVEVMDSPALTTPAQRAPRQLSEKERLIAQRLAAADDRTQQNEKRRIRDVFVKRPKTVTILATAASVLLLVGYITYLNIPNMALRVAAARAGFEANMPGYRPNGFKFSGPISYSPGQITIRFDSNTDERSYTITERETNWDSQSLLENFVKAETDLYSTFQERGLTVYIYDGSNAAWVNGGIWYTIAGDASLLNSEQLLKIATSL